MEKQVKVLVEQCLSALDALPTELKAASAAIAEIKVKYLGKSGSLTALLRSMRDLPADERPAFGALVNDAQDRLKAAIDGAEAVLDAKILAERLSGEKVDITLPGKDKTPGTLHPITLVANEVQEIFLNLGFELSEGPEIETDNYNFQMLNIPSEHAARDMQDTFFVTDSIVLRTHTSPNQARIMEKKQPPIKMICPGRTYRSDDDATHSPIFHQIEGLVVDKRVTMSDLKGTLDLFCKTMFSPETKTRLRPSYFPFTEPSVEVDMSCSSCGGSGCGLCKGTGWIEILGAGIVNPKVLENCGIDSSVYGGFAFGMGIERIAMIKYGIPDIRLFFENDVRFLRQFKG